MIGKDKCKMLKQIRAQIAKNNDIEMIIEECTHQGRCKGTCPKCEAEVAYLEEQLEKRKALGKAVCVAGISVAMIAGVVQSNEIHASQKMPLGMTYESETPKYSDADGNELVPIEVPFQYEGAIPLTPSPEPTQIPKTEGVIWPSETPIIEITTMPAVTAEPTLTDDYITMLPTQTPKVVTASPQVSTATAVTASPQVSTATAVTASPQVSTATAVTASPQVSTTTAVTANPQVSTATAVTAMPETTSEPNEATAAPSAEPSVFPQPTVIPEEKEYCISYNPQGGSGLKQEKENRIEGDVIEKLPVLTRKGYLFQGWYTQKSGGAKINSPIVVNSNLDLYAQWSKVKVKEVTIRSAKWSGKNAIAVKWKKRQAIEGYTLYIATDSKMKKNCRTIKVSKDKVSKKIKGFHKNKKYYVRVVAYKKDSTGAKIFGECKRIVKVSKKK